MKRNAKQISLPFLQVSKALSEPLYIQIYNGIRQAILQGKLKANDQLPPSRMIATDFGISRNVVTMAYEQLLLEGYLIGKTGAGTFVSGTIPGFIKNNEIPGIKKEVRTHLKRFAWHFTALLEQHMLPRNVETEEVTPFQTSIPSLQDFPFHLWMKSVQESTRYLNVKQLGYQHAQGSAALREVIAGYLRVNRAVNCTADYIIITNGTQQSLWLIAHLLLDRGDYYGIEDPGYLGARAAFSTLGAQPVPVPVTRAGIDVAYLEKKVKSVRLLYITPSHQYPLGGTLPVSQRIALLEWARKKETWIVEDDYDSELRYEGKPMPSLQGLDPYGNVIYLGTFSKLLFPSLRIAYLVVARRDMVEKFVTAKALFDRQNSFIDQISLADFMDKGHLNRHLQRMRILYKKRQDELAEIINQWAYPFLKVHHSDSGMHLVGWLAAHLDDRQVSVRLQQHGITATALSEYVLQHRQPPALLLGYTAYSRKQMQTAVQKMAQLLANNKWG